jgi:hypothetical protein
MNTKTLVTLGAVGLVGYMGWKAMKNAQALVPAAPVNGVGADAPPAVSAVDTGLKITQTVVGGLTAIGGLVMLGLTLSEKRMNVAKLRKEVGA